MIEAAIILFILGLILGGIIGAHLRLKSRWVEYKPGVRLPNGLAVVEFYGLYKVIIHHNDITSNDWSHVVRYMEL